MATGKQIVEFVTKTYPERLKAGISLPDRVENMQFLRNKIIEKGICEGLDLGLNLKRGGPSISNDFIVWRHDDITEGVDIASAYDDTAIPLKLQWHTYGPPNYGYPHYKDYGPVVCDPTPPIPPPVPPPVPPPAPPVDLTPIWDELAALKARIIALEEKPDPVFHLPALEVEGNTSRAWGHGHTFRADVKPKA